MSNVHLNLLNSNAFLSTTDKSENFIMDNIFVDNVNFTTMISGNYYNNLNKLFFNNVNFTSGTF